MPKNKWYKKIGESRLFLYGSFISLLIWITAFGQPIPTDKIFETVVLFLFGLLFFVFLEATILDPRLEKTIRSGYIELLSFIMFVLTFHAAYRFEILHNTCCDSLLLDRIFFSTPLLVRFSILTMERQADIDESE